MLHNVIIIIIIQVPTDREHSTYLEYEMLTLIHCFSKSHSSLSHTHKIYFSHRLSKSLTIKVYWIDGVWKRLPKNVGVLFERVWQSVK